MMTAGKKPTGTSPEALTSFVKRPCGLPKGVGRIDWAAAELGPMGSEEFAGWLGERYAADLTETRCWNERARFTHRCCQPRMG